MSVLIRADNRRLPLATGSVDCCVTSPGYWGQRAYGSDPAEIGRGSLAEYVAIETRAWAREVHRVLRDDGLFWLNLSDTRSNSGGAGGDYNAGGTKEGQPRYRQGKAGLPGHQACLVPERVVLDLQGEGWYVVSKVIWDKCLSGGSVVYVRTVAGVRPMNLDDLWRRHYVLGNHVELWSGEKWVLLEAMRQVDRDESGSLEVVLRTGEVIGCTVDHRWPLADGRLVEARDLVVGDVLSNARLPETEVEDHSLVPDGEVGWLVGLYLAEGSRYAAVAGVSFAGHVKETERHKRLRWIADQYDAGFRLSADYGLGVNATIGGLVVPAIIDTYVGGRGAKNKRLRHQVWNRSDRFLDGILRGYLEGDGNLEPSGRWRVNFTDNDGLVSDLRTLAARLGWSCRLRRHMHQSQWGQFPGWRGELREVPSRTADTQVVEVRPGRARKFFDLSVGEPHVFALASGVLSHNCQNRQEDIRHVRRPLVAHEIIYVLAKTKKYRFFHDRLIEKGDIWHFPPQRGKRVGPAPFPDELPRRAILCSTEPGEIVLDPAVGSGTTSRVAESLGRRAVGVDLYADPVVGAVLARQQRRRLK